MSVRRQTDEMPLWRDAYGRCTKSVLLTVRRVQLGTSSGTTAERW